MIRRGLLFLGISMLWADHASLPLPGDYDRALIAVDGDLVTGHFTDCTGECKFECNFYFSGKKLGNGTAIQTYFPEANPAIEGTARTAGKRLNLKLNTLPDGCWNVAPELKDAGAELLLNQAENWLQVRVTKAETALRENPRGKRTSPLQRGETVIVIGKQSPWYQVRVPGSQRKSGWILEKELVPLPEGKKKKDTLTDPGK